MMFYWLSYLISYSEIKINLTVFPVLPKLKETLYCDHVSVAENRTPG